VEASSTLVSGARRQAATTHAALGNEIDAQVFLVEHTVQTELRWTAARGGTIATFGRGNG
jgi:hypothetical protein